MGTVVAQYKYDGLRAQIHKDGQQVTIFSRNLEDHSHMFPELIEGTRKQVRAERAILDAEALAYNPTSEEFLPFQETTRRRRKHGIEAMAEQLPLKAFVFDLLYKDGPGVWIEVVGIARAVAGAEDGVKCNERAGAAGEIGLAVFFVNLGMDKDADALRYRGAHVPGWYRGNILPVGGGTAKAA
jgi:hypothetical protein